MLIAISKYIKPVTEIDKHRPEHLQFLQQAYAAGKLLISGRQQPLLGGVIVSKNISRDEFEQLLAQDPFVQLGLAAYQITEFAPSHFAEGLKELLGDI